MAGSVIAAVIGAGVQIKADKDKRDAEIEARQAAFKKEEEARQKEARVRAAAMDVEQDTAATVDFGVEKTGEVGSAEDFLVKKVNPNQLGTTAKTSGLGTSTKSGLFA